MCYDFYKRTNRQIVIIVRSHGDVKENTLLWEAGPENLSHNSRIMHHLRSVSPAPQTLSRMKATVSSAAVHEDLPLHSRIHGSVSWCVVRRGRVPPPR
jgi:hypothetical protein